MNNLWEIRAESEDATSLDLYIYSTVESDNWWEESETSAQHFRKELEKHKNLKQINVYINSAGGSVLEGSAIYTQLKRHSAKVTVYIDGFACSIASVIAMAGDKVIMPKNAVMMIHNALTIARGNSQQLRKIADDLDVINAANRTAYLEKSNGKITEEKLIELLDNETYLSAEQCIEYGFCDEISSRQIENAEITQYAERIKKIYAMAEKPQKQDKSEIFKKLFKI